ncbi:tail fiber assembly protein [Atlantibacter hermannii]|uniref:tail fiber assembly protein n=1 Tax=Atlantibacter hermannii TaxID=565 RepID=UPI00289C1556|nr:tail fiber assembly protein [Atlantibacter hermannii]
MSGFYYSAKTNGAYAASEFDQFMITDSWPNDAILMTPEIFHEFFIALPPQGKMRSAGNNGLPEWVDVPTLSREQIVQQTEQKKKWLIDEAMRSISVIQLKLRAERALSESEKAMLNAVINYIDDVNAISAESTEIHWPEPPKS